MLPDTDPLLTEPYTPELVDEWRATLSDLSGSFVRGEAQIDPHVYPVSCRYCALGALCRVAEARALDNTDDEAEEEEVE
jgi:hypothetical protein